MINSLFLLFFFVLLALFKEVKFSSKLMGTLIIVLAINSLLILPFLYPYIKVSARGERYHVIDSLGKHSADFGGYFLPPMEKERNITLLGKFLLSQGVTKERLGENSQFVGYVPLLLAIGELLCLLMLGVRTSRDKLSLVMILIAIVFFILSFGPFLFFNDKRIEGIKLPWYFIYKFLPPVRFMRATSRFSIIFIFSLAWLAGNFIQRLFVQHKAHRLWKSLLFPALSAVILLEYYNIEPLKSFKVHIPKIYDWVSKQPRDLGILELPTGDKRYFIYSTQHWQKIMMGAYYPDSYYQDLLSLDNFNESCIFLLKQYKVDLMIIHGDKKLAESLRKSPYFKQLYSVDNSWAFALTQDGKQFDLMKTVMDTHQEVTRRLGTIKSARFSKQDIANKFWRSSRLTFMGENADVFLTEKTVVLSGLLFRKSFPALQFEKIVLCMRARSPTDRFTTCSFYWATKQEPRLSEKNWVKLKVILDNKFHIYELNLLDSFQWITSGEITMIRFNPVIGEDIELEIDYLYFL